jgi:drug/metabolite transporter (DMT)-like permease
MNWETVWAVVLKLIVGSSFYIFTRMIMKTCGQPSYGFDYAAASGEYQNKDCPLGETAFGKGVFIMTVGWTAMSPALIYFYIYQRKSADPSSYGRKAVTMVAVPSALDMVSTALSTFGTHWISLSLAFIFKGGRVVFAAMLTVLMLKRRLYAHHWTAVALCVVGLVVAASSQLFVQPSSAQGVFLVLGSELFKGLRVVVEERLMKDKKFNPAFLVGIEGLYGTVVFTITLIVVWLGIRGTDGGSFENLPDTLSRISNSTTLIILFSLFPFITCITSVVSAIVTKNLSAVHNGLISVMRVGILWMVELVLYYTLSDQYLANQLGEPWTRYSALKLVGFVIVLFSTLLYDEDIKIPYLFKYDVKESVVVEKEADVART